MTRATTSPSFGFDLLDLELDLRGEPRLELDLTREGGTPASTDFDPLRVPGGARLLVGGPLPDTIEEGELELAIDLEAGQHAIPVGASVPLLLLIEPGSRARISLSLGTGPAGDCELRSFELSLTPAIKLANLVGVASAFGPGEALLALLPEPLRVALEVGSASADLAFSLELRGVGLASRVDGPERWLQPQLRGSLRLLDRLALPLDSIPLPRAVLPHLPPGLIALSRTALSQNLQRRLNDELRAALVAGVGALVERVAGALRARLRPPAFSLGYVSGDGTRRQIDIAATEALTVDGKLSGKGEGRRIEGELELALSSGEASKGQLSAALSAELDVGGQHASATDLLGGLSEATIDVRVEPGSALPPLAIELWQQNPLCRGRSSLELCFEPLTLEGGLSLTLSPTSSAPEKRERSLVLDSAGVVARQSATTGSVLPHTSPAKPNPARCGHVFPGRSTKRFVPTITRRCRLSTRLSKETSRLLLEAGDLQVDSALDGDLELSLDDLPEGLRWSIDFSGELEHDIAAVITPIAELDLHDGRVRGVARSRSRVRLLPTFRLLGSNATQVDLGGSRAEICLEHCELELDRRTLSLPGGTHLGASLRQGGLTPRALAPAVLDLDWDLHRQPCLLHFQGRSVSLFTEELRSGALTAHLDEGGKLSFSGSREGLYGSRYFNALLNPANDLGEWIEIFRSDDAFRHVVEALAVFSEELAELLSDARLLVLAGREILRREGITEPRHVIPRELMARTLSLLLRGDDSLQRELVPMIKQATEGHGLPLAALKHLLSRELGDLGFDIDYEINVLSNWLHLVLHAGDPYPPAEADEEPPLALDPQHRQSLASLPSAAEIEGRVAAGEIDAALANRLAELAPQLSADQLFNLLRYSDHPGWTAASLRRLRRVAQIKRRVARIGQGYGGIEHAAQPYTISAFLGEAVGPLPGINAPATLPGVEVHWPPPCALGAEEVATLLQAGLAMVRQDQRAELNNRLLLELLRHRGGELTREVLIELGHQSRRALSGILYAFLEQDQDQLAEPIDLGDFLEEQLGCEVPRQASFLAGGRRARESYYEALDTVAERIIADADDYLARKQHLQQVRHPLPPPVADVVVASRGAQTAVEQARQAIAAADALGAECQFMGRKRGPHKRAIGAYEKAFEACAALLAVEPRAFTLDGFKRFWWRNEAALRVLCSVRAYQEDLDDVRSWLAYQRGAQGDDTDLASASEQTLVDAFIETLFYQPEVRAELAADPLLRLLIDPPAGQYDFSIISCMGVITEGQEGNELVDAFRRLNQRRGVRVLRAATGTGRSLEYNAARIIEAIAACPTPWGIIGYSQGCANALLAEHLLYSGTPEQQALVGRLVCRNLLFSAANGSCHGSSAMVKYSRAMIAGERILKHYQATLSWQAVRMGLRAMRAALDSQPFVDALGGGDSLSYERARVLHRDSQFVPSVPTSHSRAIVAPSRIPECLEYTYYCHEEMCGGEAQDTQVLASDAIGRSTRVANAYTRAFAACDMGSPVLASHHWAPLTEEIEFVKTTRDREQWVYEGPKDQLVSPWVEVNARFGRIQRKS